MKKKDEKKDENQVLRITPPKNAPKDGKKNASEDEEVLVRECLEEIYEKIVSNLGGDILMKMNGDKDINNPEEFLALANTAFNGKDSLKNAKKILEKDPDNLDAASVVAYASTNSLNKLIDKYKKLIAEAEKKLEQDGYFGEDNVGKFWLILETRPYMRLLLSYADTLVECGKMRLAVEVFEKMIGLCEMDNLGARYRAMHIYAYLEDEESALKLLKKYPDDDTQMLLPLSVLYYKLGDLKKSAKYLKKLRDLNEGTLEFFEEADENDFESIMYNINPIGYRPDTIEELIEDGSENFFLFDSASSYFEWGLSKLRTMK